MDCANCAQTITSFCKAQKKGEQRHIVMNLLNPNHIKRSQCNRQTYIPFVGKIQNDSVTTWAVSYGQSVQMDSSLQCAEEKGKWGLKHAV